MKGAMHTIQSRKALRCLVSLMCRYGHMNGFFGDTGREFRNDQTCALLRMRNADLMEWFNRNRSNLMRDCGATEKLLIQAGDWPGLVKAQAERIETNRQWKRKAIKAGLYLQYPEHKNLVPEPEVQS